MANKEYVASLIGLYKNHGAVSYVGNYFPFIYQLYPARTHVNLIPNCMEFCYGQISIETATYSLNHIQTVQTNKPYIKGPVIIYDRGQSQITFYRSGALVRTHQSRDSIFSYLFITTGYMKY